jgi:hypothetical protein
MDGGTGGLLFLTVFIAVAWYFIAKFETKSEAKLDAFTKAERASGHPWPPEEEGLQRMRAEDYGVPFEEWREASKENLPFEPYSLEDLYGPLAMWDRVRLRRRRLARAEKTRLAKEARIAKEVRANIGIVEEPKCPEQAGRIRIWQARPAGADAGPEARRKRREDVEAEARN